MTVAYNQRTTPLSANSANAAWSDNVTVAYDFTGHDPAHADGTPWVFSGATSPTLGKDGSLALTTLNGEPCRVPAASSVTTMTQPPRIGACSLAMATSPSAYGITRQHHSLALQNHKNSGCREPQARHLVSRCKKIAESAGT